MALIELELPWTSQPQEVVEVRRDGSMALVSVVLPSLGPIDIATPSRSITKDANCNVTTTSDGVAYTSSDTNSGLQIGGSFVDLVPATSAITFLARVYVAATGVRRVLFSDWSAAGSANSIAFEQQVAGKWGFYSYAGTGSALAVGTVSVGWHTIAATQLANGTLLLWVDGAYLGTKAVSGARSSGTSAALLDSGASNASIGWGANQASLLTIWKGEATEEIAKAFHDSPWDFVFVPQSIWVPVSAGGGPTPAGLATEADTSLALTARQIAATGTSTETDAAQALVAVQIAVTGRADETETALALTPVQITVAGLASETDAALALDPGATGAVGVALETDTALAVEAVQITVTGIATEVDTALALTGLAGTAPGIASETDTAFALAAVQKLVAGAALEVDTALALSAPGGTLDLILKILVNRQELNPTTGTFTLYDDDGTTVLYTTNAWADAAGTTPYSGGALRRIDALF